MDTVTSTVTRDNLFAGDYPVVKGTVTVTESQTLTRGAVLGIITANGEAQLLDTAAVDGSQNFYAILLTDVTTAAAETKVAPVALSGQFHSQGLSLGGATTIADIWSDARALNCYIETTYSDENLAL